QAAATPGQATGTEQGPATARSAAGPEQAAATACSATRPEQGPAKACPAAGPEQAAATASAAKQSVFTARATCTARSAAGGVAATSCTQLAVRAPRLAAAWRLQRLPHSGRPLSWLLWSEPLVPHLQVPCRGVWRVSPLPVRRLFVRSHGSVARILVGRLV